MNRLEEIRDAAVDKYYHDNNLKKIKIKPTISESLNQVIFQKHQGSKINKKDQNLEDEMI